MGKISICTCVIVCCYDWVRSGLGGSSPDCIPHSKQPHEYRIGTADCQVL